MANLWRQSLLPNQETKIRREIVKIQFYYTFKANNTGALEAYLPVDLDCLNKADGVDVVVELVETLPGQVGASFEGFAGQFVYVLWSHVRHFRVPNRTGRDVGNMATSHPKVFLDNKRKLAVKLKFSFK